ncbi:MAG: hypothetical protein KGN98_10405 [Alphaproteobacteria bacterium]|nr:hypothetical protein [Alphaproteobacteria bacterium]
MTRLFLYLLALMAGLSPAQASRVAWAEPVAIGQLAQPAHDVVQAAPARAHIAAGFVQPLPQLAAMVSAPGVVSPCFVGLAAGVELTDRPRA